MQQKYASPDLIPDQAIVDAFATNDIISFSARRCNYVMYRSMGIGKELGWWIPLTRVFPLIGITPERLISVFSPDADPKTIQTYAQLGWIPNDPQLFLELARILGKKIEVFREDGGSGRDSGKHYHLFDVEPSGTVTLHK